MITYRRLPPYMVNFSTLRNVKSEADSWRLTMRKWFYHLGDDFVMQIWFLFYAMFPFSYLTLKYFLIHTKGSNTFYMSPTWWFSDWQKGDELCVIVALDLDVHRGEATDDDADEKKSKIKFSRAGFKNENFFLEWISQRPRITPFEFTFHSAMYNKNII